MKSNDEFTALVLHIRRGGQSGEEAFEQLYARAFDLVCQWACYQGFDRDEAEDIAQQTILNAIQALSNYDSARPFKPWLLVIARNLMSDWYRKRWRISELNDFLPDEAHLSVEAEAERRLWLAQVYRLANQQERDVLDRMVMYGGDVNQVAQSLDLTSARVYQILKKIRGKSAAAAF